jgi:DNA-binding transcriptional MerR regulator
MSAAGRPAEDPGSLAGVLGEPNTARPEAGPDTVAGPRAHREPPGVIRPDGSAVSRAAGPTIRSPAGPTERGTADRQTSPAGPVPVTRAAPSDPPPQAPAGDAPAGAAAGLAALDDADAEVYTIGQAAELLAVPVAALRRLDDAGALRPGRSAGRHRRYSRRQLLLAQRMLTLVAEGTAIAAARRIADLEGEVRDLEGEVRDLRQQLDHSTEPASERTR